MVVGLTLDACPFLRYVHVKNTNGRIHEKLLRGTAKRRGGHTTREKLLVRAAGRTKNMGHNMQAAAMSIFALELCANMQTMGFLKTLSKPFQLSRRSAPWCFSRYWVTQTWEQSSLSFLDAFSRLYCQLLLIFKRCATFKTLYEELDIKFIKFLFSLQDTHAKSANAMSKKSANV